MVRPPPRAPTGTTASTSCVVPLATVVIPPPRQRLNGAPPSARPRRNNGIGNECGPALGRALCNNVSLTTLDLGENALGAGPAAGLAAGLPLSGLRDLRLDQTRLDTEGAIALSEVSLATSRQCSEV